MSAGITLVYALGAALHWSTVCIVCGAIPLAVAAAMTLLPETPNWLANNGRREEAKKASSKTGGKFERNVHARLSVWRAAWRELAIGPRVCATLSPPFRYSSE